MTQNLATLAIGEMASVARALAALPSGRGTADDVARVLGWTRDRASRRLRGGSLPRGWLPAARTAQARLFARVAGAEDFKAKALAVWGLTPAGAELVKAGAA